MTENAVEQERLSVGQAAQVRELALNLMREARPKGALACTLGWIENAIKAILTAALVLVLVPVVCAFVLALVLLAVVLALSPAGFMIGLFIGLAVRRRDAVA